MLDNHNRVAFAFQTAYDFQQQGDVGEVQAGGGFVEDVECSAGVAFGEFQGELTRWASPPERVVADWPRRM